jgi:DNA invertase Pin-like site-specific DNA recombinase
VCYIWGMSKRAARTGNPLVAIAYCRASRDEQRLSPEAQRAAIESWARSQGVSVASWHIDQGVCSVDPIEQRPGLVAALAAVREHRAGLLVCAKRDRLARKPALTDAIEQAALACGARVVSADGASNASGLQGVMLRGMSDLFAQVEREMIRDRTRAALAAKSAKGERVGGVPYGFAVATDGVHLEPVEHEQATIGRARQLAAEGRSLRGVAAALAQEGRFSRQGGTFHAPQIARMLLASVEAVDAAAE